MSEHFWPQGAKRPWKTFPGEDRCPKCGLWQVPDRYCPCGYLWMTPNIRLKRDALKARVDELAVRGRQLEGENARLRLERKAQ